jgi:hypothetical protein
VCFANGFLLNQADGASAVALLVASAAVLLLRAAALLTAAALLAFGSALLLLLTLAALLHALAALTALASTLLALILLAFIGHDALLHVRVNALVSRDRNPRPPRRKGSRQEQNGLDAPMFKKNRQKNSPINRAPSA